MPSEQANTKPADIDELVSFISKCVQSHYEKTGRRLDGSILAHLVRTEFFGINYSTLGLTKLGDAVRIAEERGLLTRHRDVMHLEVSPPTAQGAVQIQERTVKRWYVRSDVWRAFVIDGRKPTFFHQADNTVTGQGLEAGVQIKPVTEGIQISWADQFLKSRPDVQSHTKEDSIGLARFGQSKFGHIVNRDWKEFRAAKVIDHISVWAESNQLSTEDILFPVRSHKDASRPIGDSRARYDSEIRRAILAAISEMSLPELRELAIPLKYITRHFVAK